jgi:ethanolamine permease
MLDEQSMEVLRLWSLGVGSVIGGDFFGWNSTLRGGFGAGLLSISWAAGLYFLLARCIGRLCTLLPKAQGACSFVTAGMGPEYGAVVAACEIVKLLWVLCAIGFGIVEYILEVVHIPHVWQYLVYACLLAVFFSLGCVGVKNLGNSQIFATVSCLAILGFYWISVATNLDFPKYAVPEREWFRSWDRVLESLPFGAWFFLGFEEIPLLVPHTLDVARRTSIVKKGLLYSFMTVMSSCALTFTLASGSSPGVSSLKSEEAPLVEGIKGVYGDDSKVVTIFAVFSVVALLAPFCSFFLYCTYHLQVEIIFQTC